MSAESLNRGKSRKPAAPGWYKLDNAAKIYPAISNRKWASVFRLSVMLKEPVRPDLLQQALDITLRRIPSFAVKMKAGLFWYFFEHGAERPLVQQDVANPCVRMFGGANGNYLFRVRYFGRRIALEIFHSITDGYGGTDVFKDADGRIPEALRPRHPRHARRAGLLRAAQARGEWKTTSANTPTSRSWPAAAKAGRTTSRHRPAAAQHQHHHRALSPLDKILAEAKKRGVTLTEYLSAVYLYVLYNIQKAEGRQALRPVKLSIPVNLRKFYNSIDAQELFLLHQRQHRPPVRRVHVRRNRHARAPLHAL